MREMASRRRVPSGALTTMSAASMETLPRFSRRSSAAVFAELEAEGGQADFLAGKDFYFAGDAGAIDEGAVEGIEVFNESAFAGAGDLRVMPGNHGAIEGLVALGIATEENPIAIEADGGADGFARDGAALVEKFGGFYFEGAEVDVVIGAEGDAGRDAIVDAVYGCAVHGVEIFDKILAAGFGDAGVFAGDDGEIQDDVTFGGAAYADYALGGRGMGGMRRL